MGKADKIVSSAIIGMDVRTTLINGKPYVIAPPSVKRLAGAGYFLSGLSEGDTVKDVLQSISQDNIAHALSYFIAGDDSLYAELQEGTFEEVVEGLCLAYSLISTESFLKLSTLQRNVSRLIANPKP